MSDTRQQSSERQACAICDDPMPCYRWTDTHGIGACQRCGATYRLYHYEGDERVEKPPTSMFAQWYIPFARRYWQENQRNVDPGAYNFPGSTYEVASREDVSVLNEWHEAHRDEIEAAQKGAGT